MTQAIRENLPQFLLLVLINGFVGAMVGMERSVLPNLAETEFGLASKTTAVSFLISFGTVKALGNFVAGRSADRFGRRTVLIAGWLAGLPVPWLLMLAPDWTWIIAANALLGINQALCWSVTVIMKIDLAGPRRRGLATAANEWAGYVGLSLAALATGWLAGRYSVRPAPFYLGIGVALAGLFLSFFSRETAGFLFKKDLPAGEELSHERVFALTTWKNRSLFAACQAGFTTNIKDGVMWALVPIYLAGRDLSYQQIGVVAAVYPFAWGFCQLITGPLSDRWGRKAMIAAGMLVQAIGMVLLVFSDGFRQWLLSACIIGIGTALVYPILMAVISDVAEDRWRASGLGVYRFWRDSGYAVAGLSIGYLSELAGSEAVFYVTAALLVVSAAVSAIVMEETHGRRRR
jgi:MFS family permease